MNPEHLRTGSHKDNMADRRAAGRYVRDFNGRTKINEEQAKALWEFFLVFDVTREELAKLLDVDNSTIGIILKQQGRM